jgi:hypothetical protein
MRTRHVAAALLLAPAALAFVGAWAGCQWSVETIKATWHYWRSR